MIVKMTKRKVLEFCQQMENFFSDIRDTKFAYMLQKNIRLAKQMENELAKIVEASPEMKKFEEERLALCHRFAQKDDDLKPMTKDGHYVFRDNKTAFDKEYQKLRFANGTTIAAHEKKQKEIQAFLDEETEIEFLGIKQENLPGNLSIQQLEIIDSIIIPTQEA